MKLLILLILVSFGGLNAADIKVVGGYDHTMALKANGTLLGWGSNGVNQLGLGDTVSGTIYPVTIDGVSDIIDIAVGEYHTVALKDDGTLLVWGDNYEGQLGLGESISEQEFPTPLIGVTNIIAITANYYHTIALKDDGTLLVWGYNSSGQLGLGDGAEGNYYTPTAVPGVDHIVAISTNEGHSIALKDDGTMLAWGGNGSGQLGLGNSDDELTPIAIPYESNITAIVAGGNYSIALKDDGTMLAWGHNYYGQLGLGNNDEEHSPVPVPNVTNVTAIATGYAHTMAVKDDGTLLVWGYNRDGQLGLGNTDNRNIPTLVSGVNDLSDIAAGWDYSIGINNDGTLLAWGDNYGRLGLGDTSDHKIPMPINEYGAGDILTNITAMFPGHYSTHIIQEDDTLLTWGGNANGTLGLGDKSSRSMPTVFNITYNITKITGGNHKIALKDDGTMLAWGYNRYGQLGLGNTVSEYYSPTPIPDVDNIIAVSARESSTLALKDDGTMLAWGYNRYGQLGLGNTAEKHSPTVIPNENNITAISMGGWYAVALKDDGTLISWGRNYYGQLGLDDNTSINLLVPTIITEDDNITAINNISTIAAGDFHVIALKDDGTLLAWGHNNYGQLGDGSTIQRNRPVEVSGVSNVISIAIGDYHTIALKDDGTLLIWGANNHGQLGIGESSDYVTTTPVPVMGIENIISIVAEDSYSMALKEDGTLLVWGYNNSPELGLGDNTDRFTPEVVREFKALTLGNSTSSATPAIPAIIMYLLN